LHLDVLLDLSSVWGVLTEANHGAGLLEGVSGESLGGALSDALIGVEGTGEIITVNDAEEATVELNVLANYQVLPGVGLDGVNLGDEVPLEEDALRDTGVGNTGLQDVDGVVLEVVVHGALAEAVVLVGVLNDGLLEEDAEVEDLAIVLKPLGCDSGHCIVDVFRALGTS